MKMIDFENFDTELYECEAIYKIIDTIKDHVKFNGTTS